MEQVRKKSPRAPSMALDEALERVAKAYDADRLHAAPTEVVAKNIGYKSANNGSALSALASLRYFGLLERPKDGMLAVSKEYESYRFAPDERVRRTLLEGFLRRPQLYAELLEKFNTGLPSDANLKYELIQRGFVPHAADVALDSFRKSVETVGYFDRIGSDDQQSEGAEEDRVLAAHDTESPLAEPPRQASIDGQASKPSSPPALNGFSREGTQFDEIPVRLPGGRRAWLLIPAPFFRSDKGRLKAQIDLLLTEEDEAPSA